VATHAEIDVAFFCPSVEPGKASAFLGDRLKDGRITSRFTTCVGGEFRVRLVSGVAEFEATGKSRHSEEDALAQATQVFANWEFEASLAHGGDAVDLGEVCF
jgi:hypothetical protein